MRRMIQIRNVPDDLHRQLKVRFLCDYLLKEVRQIAEQPTLKIWALDVSAALQLGPPYRYLVPFGQNATGDDCR